VFKGLTISRMPNTNDLKPKLRFGAIISMPTRTKDGFV
jgi:hypothetical protein